MKLNATAVSPHAMATTALAATERALEAIARDARARVAKMRADHPDCTDEEILSRLETAYIALVTVSGAAAGASAATPGVGTAAGLGTASADLAFFCKATASYALATASVVGRDELLDDPELRKIFVKVVLLGGQGAQLVSEVAGRVGAHWGRQLTKRIPAESLRRINAVLGQWVITKYGTTRGIIVLGKALPFGFGAAIGGAGNAALACTTVRAVRTAFGHGSIDGRVRLVTV